MVIAGTPRAGAFGVSYIISEWGDRTGMFWRRARTKSNSAAIDLDRLLADRFGLKAFRPLQREVIERVLAGQSVLAVMPTGGGKSLCYQLPALALPGLTLVISPLIALMKDQVDALTALGIPAAALNSHDTPREMRRKLEDIEAGRMRIAYVAPERLTIRDFLAVCRRVKISLLAIDEAHCVSEWGHDFRPDYLLIDDFHRTIGRPPVLALTATATPRVRDDIARQLDIRRAERILTGVDRPNLWLGFERCKSNAEKRAKVAALVERAGGSSIIYVTSRRDADELAEWLSGELNEPVDAYHAGLSANERTSVQNRFMTGRTRVVAATNAFGMGIDKPDIRAVIHAGVPESIEAYFQEIGRAGRDGEPAECTMVVTTRDIKVREYLLKQEAPDADDMSREEAQQVHAMRERFGHVRQYLRLDQCRRGFLLEYFGEFEERDGRRGRSEGEALVEGRGGGRLGCCSVCDPRPLADAPPVPARPSKRASRASRTSKPLTATSAEADATDESAEVADPELLARLKAWRLAQARARGVRAYTVFGDRDLAGIAAVAPTDIDALAACRGVGPTKLELYGESILAVVQDVKRRRMETAVRPESLVLPSPESLFEAGQAVAEVAAALQREDDTVWQAFLSWVIETKSESWKAQVRNHLSPEHYLAIRQVLQQHKGTPSGADFIILRERFGERAVALTQAVMRRVGEV